MIPISSSIFNFETSLKNNQYNINKWNEYMNDNDISEEELMDIDDDEASSGSSNSISDGEPMIDENQFNNKSLNEKINKINKINKLINQLNPIKREPSLLLNIQMDLLEFQIKYSKSDVGQYIRNKFECIIEDTEKLTSNNENNKNNSNNSSSNVKYSNGIKSCSSSSSNNNNNKQVSIFKIQYEMFKMQSSISGTQDETISKDIRHFFKKMFYNNQCNNNNSNINSSNNNNNNNHHHHHNSNNSNNIESSSLYTFLHLLKLYLSFLSTFIKNQLNQDQF